VSQTVARKVEETLKARGISGEVFVKTARRIYLKIESTDLVETARAIFDLPGVRFAIATGMQTGAGFEVLYHFAFDDDNCLVNVRVFTDEDPPVFDSISGVVLAAQYIEREVHDLLGIEFRNHPGLDRILLSEDWPEGVYPLRRGRPWEGTVEKRI